MSDALPKYWKIKSLREVGKCVRGLTYSPDDVTESGLLVLRSSNIQNGRLAFDDNVYVNFQVDSEYMSQRRDIVICVRNGSKHLIGKSAIVPHSNLNATHGAFMTVFRSDQNDYVQHLLNSDQFYTYVSRDLGATINYINNSNLLEYRFPFPPLQEQQKIASILTVVDEVIESTTAQINKLKDLKTGMMQELLTKGIGHTEFKDSPVGRIPKAWDFCRISDVLRIIESGWSPQCEPVPAMTGEWGILKTTAVSWDGFNYRENKKLPENLEPRASIQVNAGDVLITRAGPLERVGVVAHVDTSPKKIMLSDKIIRLVVNNKCNSRFLAMWLSSTYVQNQFSQNVSGMAQSQTNISQEIIKSPLMVLPTIQEQEKIVNALIVILKRIEFVELRLVHVSQTKKALMQELLTGSRRVKI